LHSEKSARRTGRLGGDAIFCTEVIRHQLDLLRHPQRAAANHAVDRCLPGTAVLALVAEHRVGVALETLAQPNDAPWLLRCGLSDLRFRVLGAYRRGQYQSGPYKSANQQEEFHAVSPRAAVGHRNHLPTVATATPSELQ